MDVAEKVLKESRDILRKETAEDLMTRAVELNIKIQKLVDEASLPVTVLVGVLENVRHKIYSEIDEFARGEKDGRR